MVEKAYSQSGGSCYSIDKTATERIHEICGGNSNAEFLLFITISFILYRKISGDHTINFLLPDEYEFQLLSLDIPSDSSFKDCLYAIREKYLHLKNNSNEVYGDTSNNHAVLYYERLHSTWDVTENLKRCPETMFICIKKTDDGFSLRVECKKTKQPAIYFRKLQEVFNKLFSDFMQDTSKPLNEAKLIGADDEQRKLEEFRKAEQKDKFESIYDIIQHEAVKYPHNIALSGSKYLGNINTFFNESNKSNLKYLCFSLHPYTFAKPILDDDWFFLKSFKGNSLIINLNGYNFIKLLNEKYNINSVLNTLGDNSIYVALYEFVNKDVLEIHQSANAKREFLINRQSGFSDLLHILYKNEIILANDHRESTGSITIPPDYYSTAISLDIIHDKIESLFISDCNKSKVLLLGDTPGMASTGLLYLASYLKKNGVMVKCQFVDKSGTHHDLAENIAELLEETQAEIVGISLKWFMHIARVFEIASIVKKISKSIKVVVGGNTASFYFDKIIENENIDYVIRGDGELPLLHLALGKKDIPNLVFKENGEVKQNEFEYVENKEISENIYLENLDDIVLNIYDLLFPSLFIYTHKGCEMQCFFCGGNKLAQQRTFNRSFKSVRDYKAVRKDIEEAIKHVSGLKFDFDFTSKQLFEYCKLIFEDIDLSNHFCTFTNVILPDDKIIDYINKKFRYVYWNIDIVSLSERHRNKLTSAGKVKRQPTDKELLQVMDIFERYANNEVIINLISGMPQFDNEDIEISNKMLNKICNKYNCFSQLFWARLHAEPGASLTVEAEKYNMKSWASDFQDFMEFSMKNAAEQKYPTLDFCHYPYIYYKDEEFNSKISQNYHKVTQTITKRREDQKIEDIYVRKDVTYKDLLGNINDILKYLHMQKIDNELIGVFFENSTEYVTAILALLSSSSVFVPLDTSFPHKRIETIVNDSNLRIILTGRREYDQHREFFDFIRHIQILFIDDIKENIMDIPLPNYTSKPEDPAYVLYTSGSTGTPKGVIIRQKGLLNLRGVFCEDYGIKRTDKVLQFANISFDASIWEIMMSVLTGSTLSIPDQKITNNSKLFNDFIVQQKISVMTLPPVVANHLEPDNFVSLKLLITAGSSANLKLVNRWNPKLRYINAYGPTESTICATHWFPAQEIEQTNIFIGQSIRNVLTFIADENLNLLPDGFEGEVCIAGPNVAEGYLNNPELTQQKFVKGKLDINYTIYKSGDFGKIDINSEQIEFLGRRDRQLKVNGVRIEKGEIENCLLKLNAIQEVCLACLESDNEHALMKIFFTASEQLDNKDLRNFLSRYIPHYMIPQYFIQVTEFPLTFSGKVDERKLMKLKDIRDEDEDSREEFIENPVEKQIIAVWKEALDVDNIKVTDNFFDIGGNSMIITHISSQLSEILNREVSIATLFNYPSIKELSNFLLKEDETEESNDDTYEQMNSFINTLERNKNI